MPDSLPLHAVLYRSASARPLSTSDVARMLTNAVRANGRHGITGVLLHAEPARGRTIFLQWFEGPEREVSQLYANIQSDPRHFAVETVTKGPIVDFFGTNERLFPSWAMGQESVGALPVTLDQFLEYRQGLLERIGPALGRIPSVP